MQNPQKRKLTKKQMALLRRRRRQEQMRGMMLLTLAVVLCIAAALFLLRPQKPDDVQTALAARAAQTATPRPATEEPAPTDAPAAQEGPASTDAPIVQEASEPTAAPTEAAEQSPEPTAAPETTPEPAAASLRAVRFRVTGDIMCTEGQLGYAKRAGGKDGYDFNPQFSLIAGALSNADYTMGNLETTIGKYKRMDYSGYPQFNSPEVLLQTLKDSGYDFLTLANNHMLDRWFDGLKTTVANVESAGFDHCGAYRTREERNSPKIVELNGIKFGFLSYTESANRMEKDSDAGAKLYGVPFLKDADIAGDVRRLRESGADVVIAFPHWGTEYQRSPDETQQKYALKLAQAGVDIILGSHPHVLQSMGFAQTTDAQGNPHDVFIAYSLGNFISTQDQRSYTDTGMILEFTVREQSDGSFACEDVGFVPTYCWKHDKTMQVISTAKYLSNPPEGMDAAAYRRMQASYAETMTLFGDQFAVLEE